MKDASSKSPFAALNPREQKEQWIWWQCQKQEDDSSAQKAIPTNDPDDLPKLKVPGLSEEQKAPVPEKPSFRSAPMRPRHGQYDSVLRRMNAASKQTGTYIPWTD